MNPKVLSTKQLQFLKMILKLHNDTYCEFVCMYPQVVKYVIADNEYNGIQKSALNVVRSDYIRYRNS